MSSETVIDVTEVSKCFHLYDRPQDRLKQSIFPKLSKLANRPPKTYFREFWATKNITFTVNRGETVGIIGRNGSGKSTLLQMICGTLTPTSGRIQTQGRIAALLELGSGFNPEFSGRDNVYMNAALLGLHKAEIDARYDDILKFADIGAFINEPVKTYSSGMMVRLAFAVQSQVDPDILVVDEALAVGDARFQAKCFDRLKKLKDNGTSILLVTHSSEQIVTHCDRALLLENGKMLALDNPKTVVNKYLDLLFSKDRAPESGAVGLESVDGGKAAFELLSDGVERFASRPNFNPNEYRWGDRAAAITDFDIRTDKAIYPSNVDSGDEITLTLAISFIDPIQNPIIGFTIKNTEGVTLFGCNTDSQGTAGMQAIGQQGQSTSITFQFKNRLGGGDYFISVGVASRMGDEIVPHDRRYDAIHIQVLGTQKFHGLIDLDAHISLHSKEPSHE
jgi:lipopolysaccharide transport system ATP-binding protein